MKLTTPRTPAAGLALALLLAPAFPAGGATKLSTTASARDFLAGDLDGTTLTSDGRLTLGPVFTPRAWPEEAAGAVVFGAASDASGRVYVATGGGTGRLFVAEPDGSVRVLFDAEEPNVTVVAVGPGGEIACGTSPGGRLWKVDPRSKEPAKAGTLAGETGESAVWSLAFGPDGTLYAGTGTKGRIWKAGKDGRASLHAELQDSHVRSLLVARDGTVLAGTSDRGLVVAVSTDGKVRTLHDFSRPEVTALVAAPDGGVYAVATSVEVPPLSQQRSEPKRPAVAAPAPGGTQEAVPQGTVSVTATTSPVRPAAAPAASREGNAEVVLIAADGFVEPAWVLPEETVYGARWDPSRGLLLATGPRGRVYSLKDRRLRLEAQVDQKQVVAVPSVTDGFAIVSATSPGVLRPARRTGPAAGSYVSAVRDAGRLARFGSVRFEGTVPKGGSVVLAVRSGNSDKPDATWSDWTHPGAPGATAVQPARYFQYRVEVAARDAGEAPVVERVELSWAERNARPVVETVSILEPGAVLPRAGASSGSAVLSVTNPDENGAFAGLEPAREAAETTGKKLFRKGFRTVTWKGTDPNGDLLRYDVEVRREGSPTWISVRRDVEDSWLSFDTTPLPDGRYRFRVTASDRASNPESDALAAAVESDLAVVDATPPALAVLERKVAGDRVLLRVKAVDALSPLAKAEGTVSADRWRPLSAADGALDGREEELTLAVPKPAGPAFIAVRVVDASGNSSSVSAEFPGEFR
jgi:hypothetical protein